MPDPDPIVAAYPDARDPRIMVAVPRGGRAAMATLWALAARLTKLLGDVREPMIGQIKLAWWRDMAAQLAADPPALPRGEPLLADPAAHCAGRGDLVPLVAGDTDEIITSLCDPIAAGRVPAAHMAALANLVARLPVHTLRPVASAIASHPLADLAETRAAMLEELASPCFPEDP